MKKRTVIFVFLMASLVITSVVLANSKPLKRWWYREQAMEQPPVLSQEQIIEDPAQRSLLQELSGWMQPFEASNATYYFEASLTAIDLTDTAHALINIPYTYLKQGDQFYLRNGKTETINTKEHCLQIDHEAQRMVLTGNKLSGQSSVSPISDGYKRLKEDGYAISKKVAGRMVSISLVSPRHIACREFIAQYDSASKSLKKVYFRQPDLSAPLDTTLDKTVSMTIHKWNDKPEPDRLLQVKKYINRTQQGWEPVKAFRQYALIVR